MIKQKKIFFIKNLSSVAKGLNNKRLLNANINQYWKRKETSDETLSSLATKVQKTESNVSAQNSAISDTIPMHLHQVEEKCSTVYPLLWTEQQYEEFKQKIS